jgi:hypothetical protein
MPSTQRLVDDLVNARWNSSLRTYSPSYIIGLIYQNGGCKPLSDWMGTVFWRQKTAQLLCLISFVEDEAIDLLLEKAREDQFFCHGSFFGNYQQLKQAGLLRLLWQYEKGDRGDIVSATALNDGKYVVIEAGTRKRTYYSDSPSKSFDSFETCLLSQMFPRNTYKTILKLRDTDS